MIAVVREWTARSLEDAGTEVFASGVDGFNPHVIDVKVCHGARGDTRVVADAGIEAGQKTLTSASAGFTPPDVGKSVIVQDAGETTLTAHFLANSDQLTGVAPTAGYGNGSRITGPGIAGGATVAAGAGTSALTLSDRTTRDATGQPLTAQGALYATIESVAEGVATLSVAARFSVRSATATYGTDDTAALDAAVTAGVTGRRAVHIPAGNYLTSGPICSVAEATRGAPLPVVYGDGIGITVLTTYLPGAAAEVRALFNVIGREDPFVAAPGLGIAGDRIVRVPSTEGLECDQILHLIDGGQPYTRGDYGQVGHAGEVVRICEVLSETDLLTYGGLEFTYGAHAHYAVPHHLEGFTLRELTIRNPAPGTQSGAARAITLRMVKDVRIQHVRFEHLDASAMRFSHTLNFRVDGCEFFNLQNVRTLNNPYGLCCVEWCSSGLMTGCIGDFGCHLFTTGCGYKPVGCAPPSHIIVANNMATNYTKAAFDTHSGSRSITFIGNHVHGCTGPAFQIRGQDCAVIEPVISGLARGVGDVDGTSGVGVYFAQEAHRGRLRGGRISSVGCGVMVLGSSDVSIVGTRFENVLRYGICVAHDARFPNPVNLAVDDVDIIGSAAATGVHFEEWDNSHRLGRIRCSGLAINMSGARPTVVASGEMLHPTWASDGWVIDGSVQIDSIAADMAQCGRQVTLEFSNACAINPTGAGNIRLLRPFAGSPHGTLSVVCDGTEWLEVGRSPGRRVLGERSTLVPSGYHTEGPLPRTLVSDSCPIITSGTPAMVAFEVGAGTVVTKGAFLIFAADSGRRNLWYALTDYAGVLLRRTADDPTATTAGTLHCLAFASAYVMPADGILYLCVVNVADRLGELAGAPLSRSQVVPILAGHSTTTNQTSPERAAAQFCLPSTCDASLPYAVLG